jgi:fructokinase
MVVRPRNAASACYYGIWCSCTRHVLGSGMRIGIDLGGTKIEVIALEDDGTTLLRKRLQTPNTGYRDVLKAIAQLVEFAEDETAQKGTVGIASPGAESRLTGLVKNSNSTALNGQPIRKDIADLLGREIRIENDANCFALSEAIDGAAAGFKTVFGVILGTGVGGGITVDKRLIVGRNRIAGEWGHNPLPWARDDEKVDAVCHCGKAGCIEHFLSGPGLARTYNSITGGHLSAQDVVAMATSGDDRATKCVEIYIDRLARSLAAVINILDPDVIVLGGGLSNVGRLYSELPRQIPRYTFSDWVDTPIVQAKHGDSSGVRGAAWLWPPGSNDARN